MQPLQPIPLDLEKRSRPENILKPAFGDDEFYSTGDAAYIFADEENDDDFDPANMSDYGEEDVVDSDFDDPEITLPTSLPGNPDVPVTEETVVESNEQRLRREERELRRAARSREQVYVDPKLKNRRRAAAAAAAVGADGEPATLRQRVRRKKPKKTLQSTLRRSSRRQTVLSRTVLERTLQQRRSRKRKREEAKKRSRALHPSKRRKIKKTFDDYMAEAERIAIVNRANLSCIIENEEARRQAAKERRRARQLEIRKARVGSTLHSHAVKGQPVTTLHFKSHDPPRLGTEGRYGTVEQERRRKVRVLRHGVAGALQSMNPRVCLFTGKKARYIDSLTRIPYSSVEAFKFVRGEFGKFVERGPVARLARADQVRHFNREWPTIVGSRNQSVQSSVPPPPPPPPPPPSVVLQQ